jgi:hypothetical protein
MVRFPIVSRNLPNRILTLTRFVPPLGAPLCFDQSGPNSHAVSAGSTNRNRWSRPDLASAIGHDPHEAEPSTHVWPPANPRI